MVKIEFYKPENFLDLNYVLDDVQMQFTATVELALDRIAERNSNNDFLAKPITIFFEGKPIGFFVLDFGEDKLEFTDNQNSVLVRSLSINPRLQRRGIGKTAMSQIPEFLLKNFPGTNEIVLAVNENNKDAYQLYLKEGYIFEGKTREGRSGLQYMMYKCL